MLTFLLLKFTKSTSTSGVYLHFEVPTQHKASIVDRYIHQATKPVSKDVIYFTVSVSLKNITAFYKRKNIQNTSFESFSFTFPSYETKQKRPLSTLLLVFFVFLRPVDSS